LQTRQTQIAQNVDAAKELVLTQENAPDTHKTEISKTSVHRIVKHELVKLQCEAAVLQTSHFSGVF